MDTISKPTLAHNVKRLSHLDLRRGAAAVTQAVHFCAMFVFGALARGLEARALRLIARLHPCPELSAHSPAPATPQPVSEDCRNKMGRAVQPDAVSGRRRERA